MIPAALASALAAAAALLMLASGTTLLTPAITGDSLRLASSGHHRARGQRAAVSDQVAHEASTTHAVSPRHRRRHVAAAPVTGSAPNALGRAGGSPAGGVAPPGIGGGASNLQQSVSTLTQTVDSTVATAVGQVHEVANPLVQVPVSANLRMHLAARISA